MKNYFLKTSLLFILVSAFVFPASAHAYPCIIHGACFDKSIVECHRAGGDISEDVYYKKGLDADINAGCPKTASNENTSLVTGKKPETDLATYIQQLYVYGMGIVGIVATIVIMVGGFVWLSSLGNASRINDAKEWIGAALSGLALALFSYTILWIINPDLVNLQKLNPKPVTVQVTTTIINKASEPTGCCMGSYVCIATTKKSDCNTGDFIEGGSCVNNACSKSTTIKTPNPNGTCKKQGVPSDMNGSDCCSKSATRRPMTDIYFCD